MSKATELNELLLNNAAFVIEAMGADVDKTIDFIDEVVSENSDYFIDKMLNSRIIENISKRKARKAIDEIAGELRQKLREKLR